MSNTETAQIIQLFGARPKSGKPIARPHGTESEPRDIASDTAGNQRLRYNRRDVWREADAVMDYWHVSMKMDFAISRVQNFGTPEGDGAAPHRKGGCSAHESSGRR